MGVEARHEEARRTAGTARRTRRGKRRWACSIASPPRLAPMPASGPITPNASRSAGSTSCASTRGVARREAEYHSSRSPGREQRDAVAAAASPARDRRRAEAGERGERVVLRPVVGDEQRQRLARAGVGRAPDADRDVRAEAAAAHRQVVAAPGHARARPARRAARSRPARAPTSRRTRRARAAGCRDRARLSVPPSACSTSSWYSSRATGAARAPAPIVAVGAPERRARGERQVAASRTAA